MSKEIKISDHFDYKRLLLFTIPTMLTMIFTSIYGMVDGYFVSNIVGKEAFSAINLIMPFPMVSTAIGMMLSTGGGALIARTLGMGQSERANGLLSMVVAISTAIGVFIAILGAIFMPQIAMLLGSTQELLPYCVTYGRIFMVALIPFLLENIFQMMLVTAERTRLSLFFITLSGVTNILLDYLFLYQFHWGIEGAAWATVASSAIAGFGPLLFFLTSKYSHLHLTRPLWDWKALANICWNGSSEMVSSLSGSICAILYNLQLMRFLGENGVAAYGVIMYVDFIFLSLFGGYLMGFENIVGYHYGAKNFDELKNLRIRSLRLIFLFSIIMFISAELSVPLITRTFVGYDSSLMDLSTHAFRRYALAFLFMGFNALGSSYFTAIGNGLYSAVISTCRILIFEILSIQTLPIFLGSDGIWISLAVAEFCSLFVTRTFYNKHKSEHPNEY